jgi:probable DNA repair protein
VDFFQHITPETTILTPNRRLAAVILKKYSAWKITNKHICWPSLDAIPFTTWLERTFQQYSKKELTYTSILLTAHQEQIIWEKILRDTPENEALLQLTDTAKLAKSAWETLKRWRIKLNDPALKTTEDSRAFLNWAEQFRKLTHKKNWIDQNSLADFIEHQIQSHSTLIPQQLILIGFTEIPPQHKHLLSVYEQMGCSINYYSMPLRNKTVNTIALTDNETEIRTMALWAKSLLDKAQQNDIAEPTSIACIVPSLETVREQVIRTFSTIFNKNEFNISAGKSLSLYPVIHDALQLLNLNKKTISLSHFSNLLRCPFIGDAEIERNKRALFDNRLSNSNVTTLTLSQLIDPANKLNLLNTAPLLGKRITQLSHYLSSLQTVKLRAISEWVEVFTEILTILGWPGERSLNSHEYQVVFSKNGWISLLDQYKGFANLFEPVGYFEALRYLTTLTTNTIFQPESPETAVQILGLLEAADIPFEHSWVIGLDDTAWPSRPKPNPFIPLYLQKMTSMPNASADRELLYCKELTKQLQQSAEHIIFSYPAKKDDTELRPSTLLKTFPTLNLENLYLDKFNSPAEKIFATKSTESLIDTIAPTITSETHSGGVKIFKTQAECPFKSFAELRLHAKKVEEPTLGLRKLDRGNILHKALELIWRELNDSKTLLSKSFEELDRLIKISAKQALEEVVDTTLATNKRYLALEVQRLEKLLWEWLKIEKSRPPFKVIALEQDITTTVGYVTTQFRVDRIDELVEETSAQKQLIIDYKTGKNINKNDWFGERLSEPQLPIYCLANPEATIGIAFAKVNTTKMEIVGVSRSPLNIPSVNLVGDINQADAENWSEQLALWQRHLEQLSLDFYHGKADVDPKDPNIDCRLCGLHALCRIHELTYLDSSEDAHE